MRRLCLFLLFLAAFGGVVGLALVSSASNTRPRSVEQVLPFIAHTCARAPAWYRGLPSGLKHLVARWFPSVTESPPEGAPLVADILRRDLPAWTMNERIDFFARGIYGSVGWIEPWILADLLLDPENKTGWNDAGWIQIPPPGVLPDWREVRRRQREQVGMRADEFLLPFDVFFRWRVELVPSERGTELVLCRLDGSWESRWETLIPANHNPALDPAFYHSADQRYCIEYGNFIRILTNDCNAQVYGVRPVANPASVPGYDPDSQDIPFELCIPPVDLIGVEFLPPSAP